MSLVSSCNRSDIASKTAESAEASQPEKKIGPFANGIGVAICLNEWRGST